MAVTDRSVNTTISLAHPVPNAPCEALSSEHSVWWTYKQVRLLYVLLHAKGVTYSCLLSGNHGSCALRKHPFCIPYLLYHRYIDHIVPQRMSSPQSMAFIYFQTTSHAYLTGSSSLRSCRADTPVTSGFLVGSVAPIDRECSSFYKTRLFTAEKHTYICDFLRQSPTPHGRSHVDGIFLDCFLRFSYRLTQWC